MKIKNLIGHLKKEIAVYEDLVGILQEETENLVSMNYQGLYDTSSRKEHTVLRIDYMGEVRLKLMNDASRSLGIDGFVNLSAIIELVAAEREKEELRMCQSAILSLIEGIKELNKVNALVVEGSLENINKTLGLLGNFLPKNVYKPTGAFEPIAPKGFRLNEGA
jgi:flagellar biosynthesis/type III secretory pathway chaperone